MATSKEQSEFFNRAIKLVMRLIVAHKGQLLILLALQTGIGAALHYGAGAFGIKLPQLVLLSPFIFINAFFLGAATHIMLWQYFPQVREGTNIASRAYMSMLAVLAVFQFAVSIGFATLLIPGLIAVALLIQAPVILMAERPSIKDSIGDSVKRSINMAFPVFGVAMLSGLLLIPALIIGALVGDIVDAMMGEAMAKALFAGYWSGVVILLQAIIGVAVYLSLNNSGHKLSWSGGDAA